MFIFVNFGPPVLERSNDTLPAGIFLLEDGTPFALESGEFLLLE